MPIQNTASTEPRCSFLAAFATFLALFVGGADAERVDPFRASVRVLDRSDQARIAGLEAALGQSLVKLSGTRRARELAQSARTDTLVRQYRYAEADGEDGEPALELLAEFVDEGVRGLVADAGFPLWPLERGTTVVWIAIEEPRQRRLLGLELEDNALWEALLRTAGDRAVPVLQPLFDLEDQRALAAAEIWGGFSDRVRSASSRYGADYVLSGRLERSARGWRGRWLLDIDGRVERWDTAGIAPEDVMAEAAHGLADRLASAFAVYPSPQRADGVKLVVRGVHSPASYGSLLAYLEGRSIVERVRVATIDGDRLELRVSATGGAEALARVIGLDRQLVPEPTALPGELAFRMPDQPYQSER